MVRIVRVGSDVRVELDETDINRLLGPRGPVGDELNDIVREAWGSARSAAPIGSGELQRGITWDKSSRTGRNLLTVSLGTQGVPHAAHYLLGHAGSAGGRKRPVGAAMVRRGIPFGNVNRRPGTPYRRKGGPVMYSSNSFDGWAGKNILVQALDRSLVRRGYRPTGL